MFTNRLKIARATEKLPNCRLNQHPPINFPWLIIDYQKIIKSRVVGTDESEKKIERLLIASRINRGPFFSFFSKPSEKIALNQFVVINREMRALWYQRVIIIFIYMVKGKVIIEKRAAIFRWGLWFIINNIFSFSAPFNISIWLSHYIGKY